MPSRVRGGGDEAMAIMAGRSWSAVKAKQHRRQFPQRKARGKTPKLHTGPQGGKYRIRKGRKVYV